LIIIFIIDLHILCNPLFYPHAIRRRQEAVDDLLFYSSEITSVQTILKTIPDLERLLSRVHSNGVKKSLINH
jgi:DNA mismatch repair protein MSH6